eukprot:6053823-Prorocentrum_lima.AAC.1
MDEIEGEKTPAHALYSLPLSSTLVPGNAARQALACNVGRLHTMGYMLCELPHVGVARDDSCHGASLSVRPQCVDAGLPCLLARRCGPISPPHNVAGGLPPP